MKKIFKSISELFFPPRCPVCGEVSREDEPCTECRRLLNKCRIWGNSCEKCGNEPKNCDCGKYNHLFEGISGVYWNKDTAKDAVYAVKFRNRAYAADYFGREMAFAFLRKFPEVSPDLVCSVPSSEKSLKDRGFNHADLMAKSVAGQLGVPYNAKALKKVRDNLKQHDLKAEERPANVKGAYAVGKGNIGKTVLLIDDIKTTGTTLSECAKQLRLGGADKVYSCVALITSKDTCKSDESAI